MVLEVDHVGCLGDVGAEGGHGDFGGLAVALVAAVGHHPYAVFARVGQVGGCVLGFCPVGLHRHAVDGDYPLLLVGVGGPVEGDRVGCNLVGRQCRRRRAGHASGEQYGHLGAGVLFAAHCAQAHHVLGLGVEAFERVGALGQLVGNHLAVEAEYERLSLAAGGPAEVGGVGGDVGRCEVVGRQADIARGCLVDEVDHGQHEGTVYVGFIVFRIVVHHQARTLAGGIAEEVAAGTEHGALAVVEEVYHQVAAAVEVGLAEVDWQHGAFCVQYIVEDDGHTGGGQELRGVDGGIGGLGRGAEPHYGGRAVVDGRGVHHVEVQGRYHIALQTLQHLGGIDHLGVLQAVGEVVGER